MQRTLILLCGNAGHGKSTVARLLRERLSFNGVLSKIDAFAAPVKAIVAAKYGVPEYILDAPRAVKESKVYSGRTVRQLCIKEGEDAKLELGEDVWANRLWERFTGPGYPVTIVMDGRFPDVEIAGLRARANDDYAVYAYRVVRPGEPVDMSTRTESLIALAPETLFDGTILNDGTELDLKRQVNPLADQLAGNWRRRSSVLRVATIAESV